MQVGSPSAKTALPCPRRANGGGISLSLLTNSTDSGVPGHSTAYLNRLAAYSQSPWRERQVCRGPCGPLLHSSCLTALGLRGSLSPRTADRFVLVRQAGFIEQNASRSRMAHRSGASPGFTGARPLSPPLLLHDGVFHSLLRTPGTEGPSLLLLFQTPSRAVHGFAPEGAEA